jgi:hypothetical protein
MYIRKKDNQIKKEKIKIEGKSQNQRKIKDKSQFRRNLKGKIVSLKVKSRIIRNKRRKK